MTPFEDFGDVVVYALFLLLPVLTGALLLRLVRFAKRPRRSKTKLLVLWGNVAVFCFLASILLAGAETYYRFFYDTTDTWGLARTTICWFRRHWKLNHSGFRDSFSDYSARIAPGKRRLTFLGDSFTAGHGIPDVEDRFANRIRNQGQEEVHVLANIGFETGDEIKIVESLIAQNYEFDKVILVYNLNDLGDLSSDWKAISAGVNAYRPGPLLQHSFFFDLLYYRLKGHFDPDIANYGRSLLKDYDGPAWEAQQDRLKKLRSLVENNHGHFLVVTFPFLVHLGPDYEFRPVHLKFGKFWQELGVPHLDLLPLYEAHRNKRLTVNSHDAHPNVYAHALAAEAIEKFLQQNLN